MSSLKAISDWHDVTLERQIRQDISQSVVKSTTSVSLRRGDRSNRNGARGSLSRLRSQYLTHVHIYRQRTPPGQCKYVASYRTGAACVASDGFFAAPVTTTGPLSVRVLGRQRGLYRLRDR